MNATALADQIIETAIGSKKNVLIKVEDFDVVVSSLLIILYRRRGDLGHKDTLAFSNKEKRILLVVYYGATETIEFNKGSVVEKRIEIVGDAGEHQYSMLPLRIHWKTKLTGNALLGLRSILDCQIVCAVELYGMNEENFKLLFPEYHNLFITFQKEKFLLLL